MIPKIEFRYSWVYDNRYRESKKLQDILKKQGKTYPSPEKIGKYIERIKQIWGRIEKKTLDKISRIYGLNWNEEKIKCYIVGFGRPFSDPLTMKLYNNKNDFIDTLTHELMHQIQIQNSEKTKKWWKYIGDKYKSETILTKNHILLHAVHWQLYLDLYNKNRLEKEIKISGSYPDYKKSWEIVKREGYENIINEFKKRIR